MVTSTEAVLWHLRLANKEMRQHSGAAGWRAWLLASRSRDSSSSLRPCFAAFLAYFRFDDLVDW